jgi:hypothetical protein
VKATFLVAGMLLAFLSSAMGQAKVLTKDPMTGLPLMPPTEVQKQFGNAPDPLPDSQVCKSKMKGEFYSALGPSPEGATVADVVAFYAAHLTNFKKVEGGKQTVFYNADRTILVIVTAGPVISGVTRAHSVAFEQYTPGLNEKTVVGIPENKFVCN